jgi:hypothetical protein
MYIQFKMSPLARTLIATSNLPLDNALFFCCNAHMIMTSLAKPNAAKEEERFQLVIKMKKEDGKSS